MSRNSKHLKPRSRTSRSRLIASMEAAARRLQRYAERAECDLGEIGVGMSLRAFAMGLRDLADMTGERRMTLRPSSRRSRGRGRYPTQGSTVIGSQCASAALTEQED